MSFVLEMSIKDEHDLFCHNSKMYYDYVESIVDYEHFEVILCRNGKKLWWLHTNHLTITWQLTYNYFSIISQLHVD